MRPARRPGTVCRDGPRSGRIAWEGAVRNPLLALASLVSSLAFAAPSALAAQAPCTTAASASTFAAWGDSALYKPFQGADFEHGASGWSWGGKANIVSGDGDQLLSAAGSHAIELPGGGLAKSPWTCVDSTMPSLRFFVRRISGTGNLTVNGTLAGGVLPVSTITVFSGSSSWAPSPVVVFPPSLTAA